jgi:urease accessory protein
MKLLPVLFSLIPSLAMAHDGHSPASFTQGLLHPLGGADHLLAMLAVGVWAGMQTKNLKVAALAPASFVLCMVLGAVIALAGVSLPAAEPMIATSLLVLGLALAVQWRLPSAAAALLVGGFAVFHGYAHGLESGASGIAVAAAFMAGMVLTTALLHGAGMVAALTWAAQRTALRLAGAGVAGYGAYLLIA